MFSCLFVMPCYFPFIFWAFENTANSVTFYRLFLYRERSPINLARDSGVLSNLFCRYVSSGLMCVISQLKRLACFYSGVPTAVYLEYCSLWCYSKPQGWPLFAASPQAFKSAVTFPVSASRIGKTKTRLAQYSKRSGWWLYISSFFSTWRRSHKLRMFSWSCQAMQCQEWDEVWQVRATGFSIHSNEPLLGLALA